MMFERLPPKLLGKIPLLLKLSVFVQRCASHSLHLLPLCGTPDHLLSLSSCGVGAPSTRHKQPSFARWRGASGWRARRMGLRTEQSRLRRRGNLNTISGQI